MTDEIRERIRKNKEKALEIQKRKREEKERNATLSKATNDNTPSDGENLEGPLKKPRSDEKECEQEEVELEDFEVGASQYVSKKEAMKMYLLPEGTLAVCNYTETQNPRNKGWTSMKLYDRGEIRRRARERWGGIRGLAEERQRREEKRFQKDLDRTKNIFGST